MKKILIVLFSTALLSSCVSSKIHEELQQRFRDVQDENTALKKENDDLKAQLQVAQNKISRLEKDVEQLVADSARLSKNYRDLKDRFADLNKSYEFLLERNETLMKNNERENRRLMERLEKLQKELQQKEDSLITEQNRLNKLATQLEDREQRVNELQDLIYRKDSTVTAVRERLKDALLNFEGEGLTIEKRGGQVYVSLENRLLFPSGSWNVDKEGKKALQQLAVVLAENPDLSVMVEGHTDSDAYTGGGVIDGNWDLSVMRATSIVKILTNNPGVKPEKITAAGRSKYLPIATNETEEGKATNRRTEIILTPDLGELQELLEETK